MTLSLAASTFVTSIRAIVTVVTVYLCGFLLVRYKILDRNGVTVLSSVSNYLMVPALFVVRLGAGLDIETLKHAWPLPVIGGITTLWYFFISRYLLVYLAAPTHHFRKFFILGLTITNMIALPLVFLASLCSQLMLRKPNYLLPHNLTDFPEELFFFTEDECREQGDLYLFLYGMFTTFGVWTIGYTYVVQVPSNFTKEPDSEESIPDSGSTTPPELETEFAIKDSEVAKGGNESRKPEGTVLSAESGLSPMKILLLSIIKPVNLAQIVGVVIGLIKPLQSALFDRDGVLEPIVGGIAVIADGSVPVINIIMSCTLALKVLRLKGIKQLWGHETSTGMSGRTLVVYSIGKMIIVPLLTLGLYRLIERFMFNLAPEDDPLMRLIIYVVLFMPSANMLVVLAQIVGAKESAEILALGILLQYAIGLLTLTGGVFWTIFTLDLV